MTAADRPYGKFYDFYSVSLETFGSTDVYLFTHVRKITKTTISSDMSDRLPVHPSVRMELGSQWTDFREVLYLSVFGKSVKKIHV